jgi:hypothetical protein
LPTLTILLSAALLGAAAWAAETNKILDDVVVGQPVAADEFHQAFEGPIGINLHFPDAPNADIPA